MNDDMPRVLRVGAAEVSVMIRGAKLVPTADGAACCSCCSCCSAKNPK